jgi:chromosome partitioning protein
MTSPAHIIVFGNEKGGSGKSTTAMHVAIGLLRLGYNVASIDLDARQGTLTRYMANRFDYVASSRQELPSPVHMPIEKAVSNLLTDQEKQDREFLGMALEELRPNFDFVVIDTPGSDTYLSRLAHSYADTLVTPMNDSFIDLDVIARINPTTKEILGPSIYTRMVEEQQELKKGRGGVPVNWIVMRNRLSHIDANNKREVGEMLTTLASRFGFQQVAGFGERVIFREMFLKGLTLLDLKEDPDSPMTMSAIAARQEVRQLLRAINPQAAKGYPLKKKQV